MCLAQVGHQEKAPQGLEQLRSKSLCRTGLAQATFIPAVSSASVAFYPTFGVVLSATHPAIVLAFSI